MTTSKELLEKICNFKEVLDTDMTNPVQLSFLSMVDNDEEYMLEQKRKKRDLKIDVITGEKDESALDELDLTNGLQPYGLDTPIISPQFHSITINPTKFISHDDLYDKVINFLEISTLNPKKTNLQKSFDLTLVDDPKITDMENFDLHIRRIITRLVMNGNIIAQYGRIGPAQFVIYGSNLINYFEKIKTPRMMGAHNLIFIFDKNINPDKVILGRGGDIQHEGIDLVDNSKYGKYFFKETPKWHSNFSWFYIK